MLRDGSINEETGNWNSTARATGGEWRDIDRKLRLIARKRSALDAGEARLLREAERVEIWRELGCVSLEEYVERILGYGPKAAQDRLRVARALVDLPELTKALSDGELAFSALRELTRVAVPRTEHAWLERARGKTLRDIEEMVAGRKKGDRPDDPVDPDLRLRTLRFEVTPATFALLRQEQQTLEQERGMRLDDDQLISALCEAAFDGGRRGEVRTRAKFQIAIARCEGCARGWQTGAGKQIAISDSALERAECDAQYVGSLDAATPERAVQPCHRACDG